MEEGLGIFFVYRMPLYIQNFSGFGSKQFFISFQVQFSLLQENDRITESDTWIYGKGWNAWKLFVLTLSTE